MEDTSDGEGSRGDRLRLAFGKRLKAIRLLRGYTQQRLAEKGDISVEHLGALERGQRNPSFDILAQLADALKVEVKALFDFDQLDLGEP